MVLYIRQLATNMINDFNIWSILSETHGHSRLLFNFHLSAKALGQSKFTIGYWPMAKFLALEEDKH